MRLLVIVILIIFSFYAQSLIKRRNRAEEEVRKLNEGLEHRIIERTAQLETANKKLGNEVAVRKDAGRVLRESEQRFRAIIEKSYDGVMLVDVNGLIKYASPGVTRILGYTSGEFVGRNAFDIMHPDDLQYTQNLFSHLIQNPAEVVSSQFRYQHKDGSWRWLEGTGTNLLAEPAVQAIVGNISDITDRKRTEESLKTKTGQLEAVAKAMSSFLEKGNWKETSTMILSSALNQTESEYGFIGVVVEGPRLRAFAIEGIIWDKNIGRELYENAMRTLNEIGYLDFPNLENLFGRVITGREAIISSNPDADPRAGGHRPAGHPSLLSFLGVPIMHGTDVVGMIGVANRHGGYSGAEQSKIEILCQAAGVLYDSYLKSEKEKLLEEERRRTEKRLVVQYAVTRVLAESATLSEATPKIIQAICETTGWDMGAIWTIDRQANLLRCLEHWHIPSVDFREFEEATRRFTFAPGVGMPGRVWATNQPVWIVDVTQDANFPRAPYAASVGLHSAFGFPIKFGDAFFGVIEFLSREIRQSDEAMLQMFAAIGSQIGQFIQRKQAEEVVKKSEDTLRTMFQTSASVIICLSPEHKILEFNSEAERLYGRNKEDVLGKDYFELFLPEAVWDWVGSDMKKVLAGEPTRGYENPIRTVDGSERILKWYVSRIPVGENQFGVMSVGYDMTELRQAQEQTRHLAYYDLLTGLPNRLMLRDNIDRAISAARRENRTFTLFLINLSRFKEVNNTLGHQNGDIILQGVARRLQDTLSEADTIAHMGGDDFAVLMTNIDVNSAPKIISKIMNSLDKPFSIEGLLLNIAFNTGISVFPGHGEDADALIRRAHIAMDEAKTTESGFCIYRPEYDQFAPEHLALMGELRSAIELNQLFLLYQPKVDIRTGRAIGVEALVRWQHPKHGVIPPDQFISLAEKTGLIRQLTFWVLRESIRQSRGWHKAGLDVSIAVNLSVRSLNAQLILEQIKGLLATWGISPGLLRLEITESIIMQNPEIAMEIITKLTKMGIKFSIDDFGTGYSSLSYLQRLPVDELKIDKSFVMNMIKDANSNAIVGSIIELGHSLGLKVVAEGVENKEILDRLALAGCDIAQGYFISKPIPHAEITAWLNKQV